MPNPIKLGIVAGSDSDVRLRRYLRDRVRAIREGSRTLYEERIVRWRQAYEAVPAEATREFPWHNASNLVVPLIAIHSDTLLARVMSAVIKTKPLWTARPLGDALQSLDGVRDSLEEYGNYVGLEPDELDLYRVYHEWFGEAIRYGTSVVKVPWIKQIEDTYAPAGDMSGKYEWIRKTMYEGPRPEKLQFSNFGIPATAKTVEGADFKYHRAPLSRADLEERGFRQIYDPGAVANVLKFPDRQSVDRVQQEKETDAGLHTIAGYGFAEWDIYECHFRYRIDKSHFCRVICSYHESSDTILRAYYHYYPGEIFIAARLFYRDDMFHGYGFCETLGMLQEEVSEIHNQRRDNMTVSNMKVLRADPDSKLHKGYRIYPSAMLPAEKDELEALSLGTPVVGEIESEQLTLQLAENRSGVSSGIQGAGAGQNSKRGVYSAMGTLSVLQEGNNRTDLNITDIRYAHTKLGRLLYKEYAFLGKDSEYHQGRLKMFGKMGENISQALQAFAEGKIALPVYASTSSTNLEVEKQNDIMLSGVMDKHYQMITQMLQQASSSFVTPDIKNYLTDAMKAADLMMKMILRHFGQDEVDRLVPRAQVTQQQQPPPGGMQPGASPMNPQALMQLLGKGGSPQ